MIKMRFKSPDDGTMMVISYDLQRLRANVFINSSHWVGTAASRPLKERNRCTRHFIPQIINPSNLSRKIPELW